LKEAPERKPNSQPQAGSTPLPVSWEKCALRNPPSHQIEDKRRGVIITTHAIKKKRKFVRKWRYHESQRSGSMEARNPEIVFTAEIAEVAEVLGARPILYGRLPDPHNLT
jgi:hypothetical protein